MILKSKLKSPNQTNTRRLESASANVMWCPKPGDPSTWCCYDRISYFACYYMDRSKYTHFGVHFERGRENNINESTTVMKRCFHLNPEQLNFTVIYLRKKLTIKRYIKASSRRRGANDDRIVSHLMPHTNTCECVCAMFK